MRSKTKDLNKYKIEKVLIANRSEIALRIERSCLKLGIPAVITVSDSDRDLYFARIAKERVYIGGNSAQESYLNIEKLIKAAKDTGCNAIHPGYGFLSENSKFARAVVEAGLIWIGPQPETIELLGSKTMAREAASRAKVPTVPGSKGGLTDRELLVAAKKIGFPVIIKAVGGGGGRGMRVAYSPDELDKSISSARSEALKSFSNSDIYLEKFVEKPRHVEVQIVGDGYGDIIHLGTRDCSTQRRHQKIVEEAPAPFLSPSLRKQIEAAAVRVAKVAGYQSAGTAEFLVKGSKFYFLEINTRIQVEHPITEVITGVDLVDLQLRIANGEKLSLKQSDIRFSGTAIEFRLYAEDPATGFMPSPGKVTKLCSPTAEFLREESGISEGDTISPNFDPMISKIIVSGENRAEAITRSATLLAKYQIEGIKTNLPFLRWLLRLSSFRGHPFDITLVEREFGAKSLDDLKASELRDPRHREPVNGVEVVEEVQGPKGSKFKKIRVIHRQAGVFEFVPILRGEKEAPREKRVLSNGFNAGLSGLPKS